MDDAKKVYREGEQQVKETWRRSDGDEDLQDKVGNVGDEVRKNLGNTGDDLRRAGDDMGHEPDPDQVGEDDWKKAPTTTGRPA